MPEVEQLVFKSANFTEVMQLSHNLFYFTHHHAHMGFTFLVYRPVVPERSGHGQHHISAARLPAARMTVHGLTFITILPLSGN